MIEPVAEMWSLHPPQSSLCPCIFHPHFTCPFGYRIGRKKGKISHFHFCLFHSIWKNIFQHQQKEFPQEKLHSFGPEYLSPLPPLHPSSCFLPSHHTANPIFGLHILHTCHCTSISTHRIRRYFGEKLIHFEENEWEQMRKRSQD